METPPLVSIQKLLVIKMYVIDKEVWPVRKEIERSGYKQGADGMAWSGD